MVDITLKSLAVKMHVSVNDLIHWFSEIGISKSDSDYITQSEKKNLLIYINSHRLKKQVLNKLILQRKTRSTLNILGSGGKNKQVQIEVRKKHTYIQYELDAFLNHEQVDSFESTKEGVCHKNFSINRKLLVDKNRVVDNHRSTGMQDIKEFVKVPVTDLSYDKAKVIINKDATFKKVKKSYQSSKLVSRVREKSNSDIVISSGVIPSNKNAFSDKMKSIRNRFVTKKSGNSKKDIDRDNRLHNRQNFRTSKLRNSKTNTFISNDKYRKNYNYFLDNGYDNDKLVPVLRHIKYKNKMSTLVQGFNKPVQVVNRDVILGETITVSELASKMAVKGSQVIKVMMKLGAMVTINQVIDQHTAQLVAEEMGHNVILRRENDLETKVMSDRDLGVQKVQDIPEFRAPIVTVMGHVDHGKTSLLDCIRSTMVAASEEGGITQHIGAYHVKVSNNSMITFLDTPGHAAFTAMRARGVQITDIVVLVVAVDDGVMLQTKEAIRHVKSMNVPMIVALNKIDKVDSMHVDRVKNDLAQQGVICEKWGGETQFINVSAKLGLGIAELLDAILLEAEILELKSIRHGMAIGVVIESYLDKGKGPVASVLVREGTLKCGDAVLCGLEYGRVRAMRDEMGRNINVAGPSIPVEIFGLSGPPIAGDLMTVVRDEKKAREVALYRQGKYRLIKLARQKKSTVDNVFTNVTSQQNSGLLVLNIILKADVQGSVEAISDSLKMLSNDSHVLVNIISSGVGGITETDATLAIAANAILIAFNVRPSTSIRRIIEEGNIRIYCHSVIYDLIDTVKVLMSDMLVPKYKTKVIALAEVRNVFCSPKLGNVAGCMILEGVVQRHNKIRIVRKKSIVYEGELESLRRFKDDVSEVRSGMECGIAIKNYRDIQSGDFIEVFENN